MDDHDLDARTLDAAEQAELESRLVRPDGVSEEQAYEAALRPRSLDELIGQERVREQLALVLTAARGRGRTPDHVLLSGPPGLGKTTLAMIIAAELGTSLRLTSGPAIQHAGDLAAILSGINEGDVLFVDEIHRMSRPAEELLYMAMEDFRVDVIVGKGPGATAIPLQIPQFTLVGATTRAGLLPGPLRDRFGFTAQLEYYEAAELHRIVDRSAALLGVHTTPKGGLEIASRSRGTPRASRTGSCAVCATTRRYGGAGSSTSTSPTARSTCTRSTGSVSTGSTAPSSTRCAAASQEGRSVSRPSPWLWERSARRSRRSPSPSSFARGSWRGLRGAASRRRRRGSTWVCGLPSP